ncbi:PREDICTED: calbindin-32-like, partial [Priapulus caudatus]|uniref:Calbindin-32-like n=1 Tax=Priapulus caudatus TaxID=37621 RepID=A0ABM1F7W2_PRICU
MASKHDNFMDKLNCVCSIDSEQFVECWKHYDMDGNGFIEGEEMDKLFSDLIHMAVKGRKLSAGSIEKLQKTFMEEYDIDKDGKIGISEMAQLLPTEENFLVLFKAEHMLSSGKDFMLIWKKYSKKHGFIGTKVLR